MFTSYQNLCRSGLACARTYGSAGNQINPGQEDASKVKGERPTTVPQKPPLMNLGNIFFSTIYLQVHIASIFLALFSEAILQVVN